MNEIKNEQKITWIRVSETMATFTQTTEERIQVIFVKKETFRKAMAPSFCILLKPTMDIYSCMLHNVTCSSS